MAETHKTIELYPHNREAYESVEEYLAAIGKAAVIHPTGTGKSYIAFKLCEQHPDCRICWCAPSEYIFRTQLENIRRDFGYEPDNITFFTYAGLMNMDAEEMASLTPDYVILDEFHRCGAAQWGNGVQALLRAYPMCPILGLSATNIRYLDNRRDMADELFDGNVASHMTLGEAIVRGILMEPVYVTALFRYQNVYERYEKRVKSVRNGKVRERAEQILEQMKRTLEQADGLDRIFDKHMKEKHGKYLVFCSGKDHMDAMCAMVPEWFRIADPSPHIYKAYSGDPETSRAFQDFKDDRSDHLRLLFCIDMLNEGIHVEDVSGVILLRPTVSPTVYKQQIGRALSVAAGEQAVIFDIVDNISGLTSVDFLKEEMSEIIEIYRSHDEGEKIVTEQFEVIDELRECRRLFAELEDELSVSWDRMYEEARGYFEANGDLLPPLSYVTPEGYRLGQWIVVQRGIYRGKRAEQRLSEDQVSRLEAIGMCWETYHDRLWEEKYAQAAALYTKEGSLAIKHGMRNPDPKLRSLAVWLEQQRKQHEEHRLPQGRIRKLEAIGMEWERADTWAVGYGEAERFYREFGHLDIPAAYISGSGYRLGNWYRSVRAAKREGSLSEDRQRMLEDIGIRWDSVNGRNWAAYYRLAEEYYRKNGNLAVHLRYRTEDGTRLGVWISGQRGNYQKGRLTAEQIAALEAIGMSWQQFKAKWYACYDEAVQQLETYGTINVPADYVCDSGFRLGSWINAQRNKYRNNKLNSNQIEALEALDIRWNPGEDFWEENYRAAEAYSRLHGNLEIPSGYLTEEGVKLGSWISNIRTRYRKGTLSPEQVEKLEAIGMVWDINEIKWDAGYRRLEEYLMMHGDAKVPQAYTCQDGYRLGNWLSTQRRSARAGRLDPVKLHNLEKIGFQLTPP